MVSVKEAVASAIEFASDLLDAKSVTLEEVELSHDRKFCLITLSFARSTGDNVADTLSALRRGTREYKIFEVDAESGQTLSMKIRELARAL